MQIADLHSQKAYVILSQQKKVILIRLCHPYCCMSTQNFRFPTDTNWFLLSISISCRHSAIGKVIVYMFTKIPDTPQKLFTDGCFFKLYVNLIDRSFAQTFSPNLTVGLLWERALTKCALPIWNTILANSGLCQQFKLN